MTENQIKPFNLVETDSLSQKFTGGLNLKLSPIRDYLLGNPAENEFIMFRTNQILNSSVDLQFFQHSNGEYTPLGIQTLQDKINYRLEDVNLNFRLVVDERTGHHIIISAPPNVDIIHEKGY